MQIAIKEYYEEKTELVRRTGSTNETVIREAFKNLIQKYARKKDLFLIPELPVGDKRITPDGTLKNSLRLDLGYWESKDSKDDLKQEIQKKTQKGYPLNNMLFEDSETAILYQDKNLVKEADIKDHSELDKIIQQFIDYQPPEVQEFFKALEQFKTDIPQIADSLKKLIQEQKEPRYIQKRDGFLELCKEEINPHISQADIEEMMVQHILTQDIFTAIFDDSGFHRQNNIAKELEKIIEIFLDREFRKNKLDSIQYYYRIINAQASSIADYNEKQKFLKIVYENFYKAYNPKAADRLGVVYTPNEIVRFINRNADHLLEKHFQKNLHSEGVEILDPAVGTGTFITDLIDWIPKQYLEYKYKNEIHANEVAILPYYIANLNIEYIYQKKMSTYSEYKNICFVDTLDNTVATKGGGQTMKLIVSNENSERINTQNKKKISVVIGNPPYNANQQNFNDFNKNREYPVIDKRIKATYVKESTAQKTKTYDMYSRFIRWASDRIKEQGIVAFVCNRSFIDARSFDGFRKCISSEFDYCYVVDTHGDIRSKQREAGGNVFGIQTGVAILFLVKKEEDAHSCQIYYSEIEKLLGAKEKLDWLQNQKWEDIKFKRIIPDKKNNWFNQIENDWSDMPKLADKKVKQGKEGVLHRAIFQLYSLGAVSNRDEWVYDFNKQNLQKKVKYFIQIYEKKRESFFNQSETEIKKQIAEGLPPRLGKEIKFTRELIKNDFKKNKEIQCQPKKTITTFYKPFVKKWNYFDTEHAITHCHYQNTHIFGKYGTQSNQIICFDRREKTIFNCLASNKLVDLHYLGDSQCFPLYRYENGKKIENITDWGLQEIGKHYPNLKISKPDIFHFIYAVLHCPEYRNKYKLNLQQELPRLPLGEEKYQNFGQWKTWGEQLMKLHLDFENCKPYPLERRDNKKTNSLRALLRADKSAENRGSIRIDEKTSLHGVPSIAWEYQLNGRSPMEWVLNQYKPKKIKDQSVAEMFDSYDFAEHKETVIALLQKLCTLSVETMKILSQISK